MRQKNVYSIISNRSGTLYVSLLDIRDEVCRRLRLSSVLFDDFLENLYRESITGNTKELLPLSISLESDIRPKQLEGSGLLRRPVYVSRVPYSIIAIAIGTSQFQKRRIKDHE